MKNTYAGLLAMLCMFMSLQSMACTLETRPSTADFGVHTSRELSGGATIKIPLYWSSDCSTAHAYDIKVHTASYLSRSVLVGVATAASDEILTDGSILTGVANPGQQSVLFLALAENYGPAKPGTFTGQTLINMYLTSGGG